MLKNRFSKEKLDQRITKWIVYIEKNQVEFCIFVCTDNILEYNDERQRRMNETIYAACMISELNYLELNSGALVKRLLLWGNRIVILILHHTICSFVLFEIC